MANPHSSVAYVEPNYIYSGLTAAANDGEQYDRAPDLEDYCISLDIIAELSSRHKTLRDMDPENRVIKMTYTTSKSGKGTVRFMSGTRVGGYEKLDSGEYAPKLVGNNVLTNYYADMYLTDIVDYGTSEMLGIKSLDIDYNSTCVPIVNVTFTDVRGMSIFQPSELNDDLSFNGIRGLSRDNIAQMFFNSFFLNPIPKFTITLKGFYGNPVSYQVMCDKFETSFDSANGQFDINTRFIGYAYSFLTDVSFNALLAAPYSDYKGEEYWESQVNTGRFTIPDKNGNPTKMPKLYEIRKNYETLIKQSDDRLIDPASEGESNKHEVELQSLETIRSAYHKWYDALYIMLCERYGEDYCYRYGGETDDEDYERVIIFTNGKTISGNSLSSHYSGFDPAFRDLTGKLMSAIDNFNSSNSSYKKLPNIKEKFNYPRVKVFRDIWINDRTGLLMFDGFHSENTLPKKETIDIVFGDDTANHQKVLKKLYNDGKYQYIDAFVIDLDYTDVTNRINSLLKQANSIRDEEVAKRKALNRDMFEKMGWYPSIENVTKIVMAHLETLMAMMYDVVDRAKGRTAADLGITIGDDGAVDVNRKDDTVAPFPRLTVLTTDTDGYSKSEDAWAGNFKNGVGFCETDMVNGLFNGVTKINGIEGSIQKALENMGQTGETNTLIPMPLTSFDYRLKENPYGDDALKDVNTFAARICLRTFNILCTSHFRVVAKDEWLSLTDKLGTVEANNFLHLNKIINPNIIIAISEGGVIKTGDDILNIVTGDSKGKPWDIGNNGNLPLFKGGDSFWLSRYRDNEGENRKGLYPVGGFSFSEMDELFNSGKRPVERDDVIYMEPLLSVNEKKSDLYLNVDGERTFMNTIDVTTDYKSMFETFTNAQSCNVEEYKSVVETLSKTNAINLEIKNTFISDGNKTFAKKADSTNILNVNNYDELGLPKDDEFRPKIKGGIPRAGGMTKENVGYIAYAGYGTTAFPYKFDKSTESETYISEALNGSINSYTLTECFGYKEVNGIFKIDKDHSLFATNLSGDNLDNGSIDVAYYFLAGIDSIDYTQVKEAWLNSTYVTLPKLAVLQIGAVIRNFYLTAQYGHSLYDKFNEDGLYEKRYPLPEGFEQMKDIISSMHPYAKLKLSKCFINWKDKNYDRIKKLKAYKKKNVKYFYFNDNNEYEKAMNQSRLVFNQESEDIKYFTNDLFSFVCVSKLSINAANITPGDPGRDYEPVRAYTYKIDQSQAKVYLDAFLKTVREANGIQTDENGGPTTMAGNPSQTTEDMKIELYRYLKQLHDKWVVTSKLEDWNFDNFFGEVRHNAALGNKFFFIDSFYNKIGNKLLINPMRLSEAMLSVTQSRDTNVTMYNFLTQVFSKHRCMVRCVQNFIDLSRGIDKLFITMPYNTMPPEDRFSDMVVVYSYESSRNLDISNSEYSNDGFMLNDEFETPIPIKSRGDESKFYKVPAFGVSYGRQYQNYFKSVNVDMSHPVMTEQALIAKHNILAASRNGTFKSSQAQDLYDIYSNQSYTCNVEMMGCAYIQPLMYFVLLNVPFFKGSYLISKVRHKMRPGDMSTTITGVRMSKYCNRLIEDIFTDQEDLYGDGSDSDDGSWRHRVADTSNDCEYKVFPIGEDSKWLSETNKRKIKELMNLIARIVYGKSNLNDKGVKIAAAGIVGNMAQESYDYKDTREWFKHDLVVKDSDGYPAGGLCMWNDKYCNLTNLINNNTEGYGSTKRKSPSECNGYDWYRKELNKQNYEYQVTFMKNTMKSGLAAQLSACTRPEDAAEKFRASYEKGEKGGRESYARDCYDAYDEPEKIENDNDPSKFAKQFLKSIQRSINSTGKYACGLNGEFNGGRIIITTQGGGEKLAVVFDIILNSNTYYTHVKKLQWLINNAPTENPRALMVEVIEGTVQSSEILVGGDKKDTYTRNSKLTGDECNEKLMQSLVKKFGSSLFNTKECPQFVGGNADLVEKYKPGDCGSLYSGGDFAMGKGIEISEGGMIGDWNARKAAEWLVCSTMNRTSQRICAFAVQQAIIAGGVSCPNGNGYRKAIALHDKQGWSYVAHGSTMTSNINFSSSYTPQVGDVIGMVRSNDTSYYGHVCMYCGSEYGWVSDYIQKSKPYPYESYTKKKGIPGEYWVVRYSGNGTKASHPKRCNNGKCLNNCPS